MPIHIAWQPLLAQAVWLKTIVSEVMEQTIIFKRKLEHLKTTLDSLIPKLNEIGELYKMCDAPSKQSTPDELMSLLQNGKKLVDECKDCWSFFKWVSYSAKLTQLDDALVRFCQVDLQLEQLKGIKSISVQMKAMNEKLDALNKKLDRNTTGKTSKNFPYWIRDILIDVFACLAALSIAAIAAWLVLKFLPIILVVLQFNLVTIASWVAIFIAACGFPTSFAVLSIGIVACVGLQFNLAAVLPWLAISMFILVGKKKETFSDDFFNEILLGGFSGLSVLSTAAIAVWVVLKLLLLVGLEFNFATVASWVDISIAALEFSPALAVLSIGIVACVGLQFNFATVVPWVAISIIILIRSQKESISLGVKEESTSLLDKEKSISLRDKEETISSVHVALAALIFLSICTMVIVFICTMVIGYICKDTDNARASPVSPNKDRNASVKSK